MNGSPASPWPGRLAWTLAGLAIAVQTADFVFSLASDAVGSVLAPLTGFSFGSAG